jgi:hypothetical protein
LAFVCVSFQAPPVEQLFVYLIAACALVRNSGNWEFVFYNMSHSAVKLWIAQFNLNIYHISNMFHVLPEIKPVWTSVVVTSQVYIFPRHIRRSDHNIVCRVRWAELWVHPFLWGSRYSQKESLNVFPNNKPWVTLELKIMFLNRVALKRE